MILLIISLLFLRRARIYPCRVEIYNCFYRRTVSINA